MNTKNYYQKYSTEEWINQIEQGLGRSLSSEERLDTICHWASLSLLMGLFDERIAYKPFEYPEYYTEGWLKQAQAFWLHTEISMQSDIKDWKEKLK